MLRLVCRAMLVAAGLLFVNPSVASDAAALLIVCRRCERLLIRAALRPRRPDRV